MIAVENIDFTILSPVLWKAGDKARGFKCARQEFQAYLQGHRIHRDRAAGIGQCWVLIHHGRIAGYITLLADKLDAGNSPLLKDEGIKYTTFPAIKIGLLAVDKRLTGRGIGVQLVTRALAHMVCSICAVIGARFMTVDALVDTDCDPPYDASGFYEKMGFRCTNQAQGDKAYRSMYIDMKPFMEAIQATSTM